MGVNLAKNTESADATQDYVSGVRTLGPLCDFLVLNVSCPNVKWTAALSQDGDAMSDLVGRVKEARDALNVDRKPALLLKLGPDMDAEGRRKMAHLALKFQVDGIVVSNTTNVRPEYLQSEHRAEKGGLSGRPLKFLALETLRDMYCLTEGRIPIIGVGGIENGRDAYERIRAGASLVQVYSALTYNGPGLVRRMNEELLAEMEKDGATSIAELVGCDAGECK